MKVLITIICMMTFFIVNAQVRDNNKKKNIVVYIIKYPDNPKEFITSRLIVNTADILKLEVISEKDKALYTQKKGDVYLLVTPKPEVRLVKMVEIFNHFKVLPKYRNLEIIVDDNQISEKEDLIAQLEMIKSLKVNNKLGFITIETKLKKQTN